ncbi:MAG: hypothetical protein SF182_19755 [Deltaproteobacteria bacterium]|nr:hypothetical protein [Deltaproteobacteria bacterium]
MLLGVMLVGASAAGAAVVRVEAAGEAGIALEARGASIGATLDALARELGFDVWLDDRQPRAPVTIRLQEASLEALLRELLRGRNFALVYDAAGAVDQVIVLAPSKPGSGRPAPPPRRAKVARPRLVQTVIR